MHWVCTVSVLCACMYVSCVYHSSLVYAILGYRTTEFGDPEEEKHFQCIYKSVCRLLPHEGYIADIVIGTHHFITFQLKGSIPPFCY